MATTVTVASRKTPSSGITGVSCGAQEAGTHAPLSTNGGGACESSLDDDDWNGFNPFLTDRLKHLEVLERLAVDAKAFFSDEGDEEEEEEDETPEAPQSLPRTRPLTHSVDAQMAPDQPQAKPASKKASTPAPPPSAAPATGGGTSRLPGNSGQLETKALNAKHAPHASGSTGTRQNVSTPSDDNRFCGTSAVNQRTLSSASDPQSFSSGPASAAALTLGSEPQETKTARLKGSTSQSAVPGGIFAGRGASNNASHDSKAAQPGCTPSFASELVLDPPEIPSSLQTVFKFPAQEFKGTPMLFSSMTTSAASPAEPAGAVIAEAFNKSETDGSVLRVWRSQRPGSKQGAGAPSAQEAALLWDVVLPVGHSVTHMRLVLAPEALSSPKSPCDTSCDAAGYIIECHLVVVTVPVRFGDGTGSQDLGDPSLFSSVRVFDALTGVCFLNAPFLACSRSARSAENLNKTYHGGAVVRLVVPKISASASGDLDGTTSSAPTAPSFLVAVTCYGTLCVLGLQRDVGWFPAAAGSLVSGIELRGASSLLGCFANLVAQAALRRVGLTALGDSPGSSEFDAKKRSAEKTPRSPSAVGDPTEKHPPVLLEKASSMQHTFSGPSIFVGGAGSLQILLRHATAASIGGGNVIGPSIKPLRISGVDLLYPCAEDKKDDTFASNSQLQQKNQRAAVSATKRVRVIVYMSNGLVYGCIGLLAATAGFGQSSNSAAGEELQNRNDAAALGWVRVDALDFVHSDFFRYHDVTMRSMALHSGRDATVPPVWSLARLQARSWSLCQAMLVKSSVAGWKAGEDRQLTQNSNALFTGPRPPYTSGVKLGVTKRNSRCLASQRTADDSNACPKLDRTLLGKVLLQCLQASPLGQTLQLGPVPKTLESLATTPKTLATTRLGHCNLSLDHVLHQVQASVVIGSRMECLAWVRLLVQRAVDLECYGVLRRILIALSSTARNEALIRTTEVVLRTFYCGPYQPSNLQSVSTPYQGVTRPTWGDYGHDAREHMSSVYDMALLQRACFATAQHHPGLLNEDEDEDGDVFISKNKNTSSGNTGSLEMLCNTPSVVPNASQEFPAFPACLKTMIEELQFQSPGCNVLLDTQEHAEDSTVFGWMAVESLQSMHLTATELIEDITKVLKTLLPSPGSLTGSLSSDIQDRSHTEKAKSVPYRAQHIQKLLCNVEEVLGAITKDSAAWAQSLRNVCGMAAYAAYHNEQHLAARRFGESCDIAGLYGKGTSMVPGDHVEGLASSLRTLSGSAQPGGAHIPHWYPTAREIP